MTTPDTFFFTATRHEINDAKSTLDFEIVATTDLDSGLAEFKVICTPDVADKISRALYGEGLMDD